VENPPKTGEKKTTGASQQNIFTISEVMLHCRTGAYKMYIYGGTLKGMTILSANEFGSQLNSGDRRLRDDDMM
jgi:hypothetical protein